MTSSPFSQMWGFFSLFRREILFDYEQYEYHGTSVSTNFFAIKIQGANVKVVGQYPML